MTFPVTAGTEYHIVVAGAMSANVGDFILNWYPGPPVPANDNFASAEVLVGSSGSASGTNVTATREVGEPFHDGKTGDASVWYQWTASVDGLVEFDTLGSGFDTVLAVYIGSEMTALTLVISNDDSDVVQSKVSFVAVSGTVYRVAVDGYSPSDRGGIQLNWGLASP